MKEFIKRVGVIDLFCCIVVIRIVIEVMCIMRMWILLGIWGWYLVACNVAANVVEVPIVCQSMVGEIACEHLGAERVREATFTNGIVRIVYKWEIVFGWDSELDLQNADMIATYCGIRDVEIDADSYRIEALIDLVDVNGNQWEERGVAVTLDDNQLSGLNCANQRAIQLDKVGSYVLHVALQR